MRCLRKRRKCKNCRESFDPDYRNHYHQKYCTKPECRSASKAASQRRWLAKPENHGHFRGQLNVDRVRAWRAKNPGYWRRHKSSRSTKTSNVGSALQDVCHQKTLVDQEVPELLPRFPSALQDLCFVQPPVIIGLVAHLTGLALQDDIAKALQGWHQLGADILRDSPTLAKGDRHGGETPYLSRSCSVCSKEVQLAGSPAG